VRELEQENFVLRFGQKDKEKEREREPVARREIVHDDDEVRRLKQKVGDLESELERLRVRKSWFKKQKRNAKCNVSCVDLFRDLSKNKKGKSRSSE
jgi:uncharacterized protein YlxW (UPF0749 family)